MTFAFFGASLVSGYTNGAVTYVRGVLRALAERGHVVRFYEPIDDERLARRDILDPSWAEIVRFTADGAGVEAALDDAHDADVIVKSSGIGVFDDLLEGAVPQCTRTDALAVYWDLDPAATLARIESDANYPLRAQLPWYDLVLTRIGDDEMVEAFERIGVQTCFPVYNALDADVHHPEAASPQPRATLLYMGHRHADRDVQVQQAFFDVAVRMPTHRFLLAGCGWESVSMPSNVDYLGYVYTAEHNLYHCSTLAALNLTDAGSAALGYAPTARLFEAAGAATCVISDAWSGIDAFFDPGREVLIAHETAEIVEQLCGLGADRAGAIGRRARWRSRIEHTYARRAAELEALLEGLDRQWASKTAL